MLMYQPKNEVNFEKFRKAFYSSRKLNVEQDWMTYAYDTNHLAVKACCDANRVIQESKLPLVALYQQGTNTFIVQPNETPDI